MAGTMTKGLLNINAGIVTKLKISDPEVGTAKKGINLAGITVLNGKTAYIAKTNDEPDSADYRTAIFVTDNYRPNTVITMTEPKVIINYIVYGLTTDVAKVVAACKGKKIIRFSTYTGQVSNLEEFKVDFVPGSIAFYETDGNTKLYIVKELEDPGKNAIKFYVGSLSNGKFNVIRRFTVENTGLPKVQDIHYEKDYGLFIATNSYDQSKSNPYYECKNDIMIIDIDSDKSENKTYMPHAVISVNKDVNTYYKCNIESLAMDQLGNLVIGANTILAKGDEKKDELAIMPSIHFENGTFYFDCSTTDEYYFGNFEETFSNGKKVSLSDVGGMCLDTSNPPVAYFCKSKLDNETNQYYGGVYKSSTYKTGAVKSLIKKFEGSDNQSGNIFHGNGMCYYDGFIYAVGYYSSGANYQLRNIARINASGVHAVSYFEKTGTPATGIASCGNGKFLLLDNKRNAPAGKFYVELGSFAGNQFVKEKDFLIKNTGHPTYQDIYYHQKYGLFIVTTTNMGVPQTSHRYNRILHVDLERAIASEKYDLVPDYALNIEKSDTQYSGFELESADITPDGTMVFVANKNIKTTAGNEDGFVVLNTIKFK